MDIEIYNCNNIDFGTIKIKEGGLNIKYAINGTGKSTISHAISYSLNHANHQITDLKPYKCKTSTDPMQIPTITGIDSIHKCEIFDEEYIEQYIYQPDEIVKNCFKIFVKTQNYDSDISEINKYIEEITKTFEEDQSLDTFISDMSKFIDGAGNAQSSIAKSSKISKALKNGNKIEHIPDDLEIYKPFLQHEHKIQWLSWQESGSDYLEISSRCPYCASQMTTPKETILKIKEEYDVNSVKHLTAMLEIFKSLSNYFTPETNEIIKEIFNNIGGISKEQESFLLEIRAQMKTLKGKLERLKYISFTSLKDVDKIVDELRNYKIDLLYLSHLNSEFTQNKISIINQSLDTVLDKAQYLQGKVNNQKGQIARTIKKNCNDINNFLTSAGFKYTVSIDEQGGEVYKMQLRPKTENDASPVNETKNHLSFGERNAFALVLFMYGALAGDPDLIILDDPISSFDGNKKFAILNMLFMSDRCFKNRTVLLLTHEFNTVIDAIYTLPHNFSPKPVATFLKNDDGILSEINIEKKNIMPFHLIAENNIANSQDNLNKLVYLRRSLEIQGNKGDVWDLVSNIFHKRSVPTCNSGVGGAQRKMTQEEIDIATSKIQEKIPTFDYPTEYSRVIDNSHMKKVYDSCNNNYEKLQIYRIIITEPDDPLLKGSIKNKPTVAEDKIIKKFVDEIFHVQNDYIFQLNPCEYEIVPHYIIEHCDAELSSLI